LDLQELGMELETNPKTSTLEYLSCCVELFDFCLFPCVLLRFIIKDEYFIIFSDFTALNRIYLVLPRFITGNSPLLAVIISCIF
jgi:hypothetical protein